MNQFHFVQSHPMHVFSENDDTDYSQKDEHFIQCLKAMENIMDIDAYIIDYRNQKILYLTKGCSLYAINKTEKINSYGFSFFDNIILREDRDEIAIINAENFQFLLRFTYKKKKKRLFNS